MLDRYPCIGQLLPLGLGRHPFGGHGARAAIEAAAVPGLHQEAPGHRAHVVVEQHVLGGLGDEHDHRLAARENLERLIQNLRRDDDVSDDLDDLLRGVAVEGPVHRDDAAERADLVALVSHAVRDGDAVRDREPAWVGVLDDRRGREAVVGHQLDPGRRVLDIVEAELLALSGVHARGRAVKRLEAVLN